MDKLSDVKGNNKKNLADLSADINILIADVF
jgi:hypothetical protein